MSGEVKTLVFAEGTTVSAPTQSYLPTARLLTYASDAAYVSAKGSAAQDGDVYANTTDKKIHHYDSAYWRIIENAKNNYSTSTDPTVDDDITLGYVVGSKWLNSSSESLFICIDNADGAANWLQVGQPMLGKKEVPTGPVNGSNTDFTVSLTPIDGTLIPFRDGIAVQESEYSFTHPTITFTVAPALGQKIEAYYLTEGQSATVPLYTQRVLEYHTITAGDITAKQITLSYTPVVANQTIVDIVAGVPQGYSTDFIVSGNILAWDGLGLEGQIAESDILRIDYYRS